MIKAVMGRVIQTRKRIKETVSLRRVPAIPCDCHALIDRNRLDIENILSSETARQMWLADEPDLSRIFPGINMKGGINPGDRRAIYFLIRYLRPGSVLEVGTHIGSSTIHIAAALRSLKHEFQAPPFVFNTVDRYDVNDELARHWVRFDARFSPAKMIEKLGCDGFVSFINQDSFRYLEQCQTKYDFIFLDGSHAAASVYREIPAALQLLNNGGCILLHDYFPDLKPLWSNGKIIPGPYLAVARLRAEGNDIDALPMGQLPWETKLGSKVSSLALLYKK
jgi:predicted O-methyltransferase YrrM